MPRVSIVLPTYNGARYLMESVHSCLSQTFADIELIILLDTRTRDNSRELLEQISDKRLRIIDFSEPGQANALNRGFSEAMGEYWTWTHDDNIYADKAIEEMVRYLDENSSAQIVQTWVDKINGNGAVVGKDKELTTCFLYRATAAQNIGPYDPRFELVHDAHYWCRMTHTFGPIPIIQRTLYQYRLHPQTRTSTQGARRALVSLNMHTDLYLRRYFPYSLESKSREREIRYVFSYSMDCAALHRAYNATAEMVKVAEDNGFPWARSLQKKHQLLRTPLGWAINRMHYALIGIYLRFRKAMAKALAPSKL